MLRPTRNPHGFTGVEILVVLAIIGILAGTGYATLAQHRVRAAEAEMRQDLVHFVNQQQVLRQKTGGLGTLDQLTDIGFRRSPGVVVEASRLESGGRRVYLRVRHRQSGQRCSVDYSPYVSNALNRVQCWAGPNDDSAVEHVGAAEVATTVSVAPAPVDTATIRMPRPECETSFAPTLDSPADQNLRPGVSGSGVFTLRNRAPSSRTFSLGFSSSNPAVVPSATGVTSMTVPAGGSQSVTASFQVSPSAEAGQVAVLPLEVADAQCPGLAGSGFFTVAAELVLGPLHLSAPANVTREADVPFQGLWTAESRTNQRRMMVFEAEEQAGLIRTGPATWREAYTPGAPQTTPLEYRISSTVDGFDKRQACVKFYDAEAGREHSMTRRECFLVEAAFIPRKPQISAPASREAGQDETFTTEWTVVNTSNAARIFTIRAEAGGDLRLEGPAESEILIPRGAPRVVRVTYRLIRPSVAGTASYGRLHVADKDVQYVPPSGGSAQFVVNTRLEVCAPRVAGAPAGRSELPGAPFTGTWQITNCTNAPRSIVLAPSADADAVADGVARTEPFAPFETRAVTLAYRLKERSVAGTQSRATLQARDADRDALPSSFGVTTLFQPCAPTMTGPTYGAVAQPQLPGTSATVGYTVENCSNAPRRFSFRAVSSNPAVAAVTGTSPDVEIPAYGTSTGQVSYTVPERALGLSTAGVTFTASDPGVGETSQPLPVMAAIVPIAPSVGFASGQTVKPGVSEVNTASIYNRSNVDVRICYQTRTADGNVAAPQVVESHSAPDCQLVAAFGTANASVPYTLAGPPLQGWTNQVVLRAYDESRSHLSSEAAFTVTTDLVVRNAAAEWVSGVETWTVEEDRAHFFRIRNQSNSTRHLCYIYGSDDLGIVTPMGGPGEPNCDFNIPAGGLVDLSERLFTGISDSREGRKDIWVRVWDRDLGSSSEGYGRKSVIISPKPEVPSPVACYKYDKRWTYQLTTFDASCSHRNKGSPIVAYEWDWGMPGSRWSEEQQKFVSGGNGLETVSSPTVQRAYDFDGPKNICVRAINEAGKKSEPFCGEFPPNFKVEVRARLRGRFQSWWAQYVGDDKGHARWEYDFSASQGGVGIKRASVVQLTDFATPGGGAPFKQYDYQYVSDKDTAEVSRRCGTNGYWDYPAHRWCFEYTGRMRVSFDTPLTSSVGGYGSAHGLYSNEGLGQKSRNGRQPDVAPIKSVMILEVVDGEDNVTYDTLYYGHYDGDDRPAHYNYEPGNDEDRLYRTSDWINFGPNYNPARLGTAPALVKVENGDGTFTFSAQGGVARDGRVVTRGVHVVYDPGNGTETTQLYTGATHSIGSPDRCGYHIVTPYWTDNFGRTRFGSSEALGRTGCEEPIREVV